MHFTLTNQPRLVGFAARSSPAGEEQAPVVFREFVTSEDGERLVQRLESLSNAFLAKAPPGARIQESLIDHLIALLHLDGRVEVWVNEPGFRAKVRVKRDVAAGEPVMRDDVANIAALEPLGFVFPPDAGYVVLFSVGWRKGLAFDFSPLIPAEQFPAGTTRSTEDVPRLLGGLFTYLLFRNRFILTEDDWARLFAERWFPFAGLPADLIDRMTQHARDGWPLDGLLPNVLEAVRAALPKTKALVASGPLFGRHRKVLGDALKAFERGEYQLSAAAIYPRVEGLLREHHALHGVGAAKPHALVGTATDRPKDPPFSLLLPLRFQRYLTEVFFGFEDFSDPTKVTRATRHAVAHGVASDDVLDEKAAALGVLLLEQLAYLLPGDEVAENPVPGEPEE
jgi:hypothetical protein